MTSPMLVSVLVVIFAVAAVMGEESKEYPLEKECLACICKGVSKCDLTKKCTHNGGACGPFRITWPFWADAKKPVPEGIDQDDDEAFKACAFDYDCSVKTVRSYMETYSQDCNGDKKINCIDYAHIFRLGGYGCNAKLDNLFKSRFDECFTEKKLK